MQSKYTILKHDGPNHLAPFAADVLPNTKFWYLDVVIDLLIAMDIVSPCGKYRLSPSMMALTLTS